MEKIPAALAKTVTEKLTIPTIGIGAGADCDGQVLVINDMLGMNADFKPKFMRHFANLHEQITTAVSNYVAEVKAVQYPNSEEQY
ncbi:3-methyl-2-oxobutanoate hydroxymethyltransferase [compost metagenome]